MADTKRMKSLEIVQRAMRKILLRKPRRFVLRREGPHTCFEYVEVGFKDDR